MHKLTKQKHKQMLYPAVRVSTDKAGGSGTILYGGKYPDSDEYHTYLLTNHHVVSDAITVRKKWEPKIGKDIKKEVKKTVHVETFQYKRDSHCIGATDVEADIVAYDEELDIALIKTRAIEKPEHIASFIPFGQIKKLKIFDDCFVIGASLGHPPIPTHGIITFMDDEIDNTKYWMSSAQIIYGNSGGAVFVMIDDKYYFTGIPSRVEIAGWDDVVTHMGYFLPPMSIIEFLNKHHYEFIWDSRASMVACDKKRNIEVLLARKALEREYGVVT